MNASFWEKFKYHFVRGEQNVQTWRQKSAEWIQETQKYQAAGGPAASLFTNTNAKRVSEGLVGLISTLTRPREASYTFLNARIQAKVQVYPPLQVFTASEWDIF